MHSNSTPGPNVKRRRRTPQSTTFRWTDAFFSSSYFSIPCPRDDLHSLSDARPGAKGCVRVVVWQGCGFVCGGVMVDPTRTPLRSKKAKKSRRILSRILRRFIFRLDLRKYGQMRNNESGDVYVCISRGSPVCLIEGQLKELSRCGKKEHKQVNQVRSKHPKTTSEKRSKLCFHLQPRFFVFAVCRTFSWPPF